MRVAGNPYNSESQLPLGDAQQNTGFARDVAAVLAPHPQDKTPAEWLAEHLLSGVKKQAAEFVRYMVSERLAPPDTVTAETWSTKRHEYWWGTCKSHTKVTTTYPYWPVLIRKDLAGKPLIVSSVKEPTPARQLPRGGRDMARSLRSSASERQIAVAANGEPIALFRSITSYSTRDPAALLRSKPLRFGYTATTMDLWGKNPPKDALEKWHDCLVSAAVERTIVAPTHVTNEPTIPEVKVRRRTYPNPCVELTRKGKVAAVAAGAVMAAGLWTIPPADSGTEHAPQTPSTSEVSAFVSR